MPILIVTLALAAAAALGFLATSVHPMIVFTLAAAGGVSLLAFVLPKLSLSLLVVSMLFSPEIGLSALSASRSVVVRYDDILLVVIFLAWLARTAVSKGRAFIANTPVQTPILAYTFLCVLSTALGVLRGDLRTEMAFFYVLKYVEYFLLYFMTVNVLDSKADMRKYLKLAFYVSLAVTAYAYVYYAAAGPGARASAPFEAPFGKPEESEPA